MSTSNNFEKIIKIICLKKMKKQFFLGGGGRVKYMGEFTRRILPGENWRREI